MTTTNTDVDLYEELRNTLKEAEVEETSGASDQKPTIDNETIENSNIDEGQDFSDDELSKLTPRAQQRIREQAAEIKRLSDLAEITKNEEPLQDDTPSVTHDFKNVNEFLDAVEDEPSRNLLEKFYKVVKSEISDTLSPIEKANNEAKFDNEFAQYENKVEGLKDYKNDLKKTFLRNPSQSIKSLISETITDIVTNKVIPIEKTTSNPNRGKVDISNLSKDELYEQLNSLRE